MEGLKEQLDELSKEDIINVFNNYVDMKEEAESAKPPKGCPGAGGCGVCVNGVWVPCG